MKKEASAPSNIFDVSVLNCRSRQRARAEIIDPKRGLVKCTGINRCSPRGCIFPIPKKPTLAAVAFDDYHGGTIEKGDVKGAKCYDKWCPDYSSVLNGKLNVLNEE